MQIKTTDFVVLSGAIVALLSVTVLTAPAPKQKSSEGGTESKADTKVDTTGRHQQQRHSIIQSEPFRDTYGLLQSLRKVQGHNGKSPLCQICSVNIVDANTYDYFCMPTSAGLDGEICDRLTFLGITSPPRISVGCKQLLSRIQLVCK